MMIVWLFNLATHNNRFISGTEQMLIHLVMNWFEDNKCHISPAAFKVGHISFARLLSGITSDESIC